MPYVKRESFSEINWLASEHYINFTEYADKSYKSGEVFKKGDVVVGLVFNDVTVGTDDVQQPMSVMVEGYVVEDRLPAKIEAADKTALTGIKFK
ncbi:hypothetical protein ACPBEH_11295 [Latilactobacillus sp. 5-91]|uniref:hypothetical protein n=1 Tax=Latilactobacillus sp. 5-91 TaxID=3410924 RepID=UPI003C783094